jgi:hypothetical protein
MDVAAAHHGKALSPTSGPVKKNGGALPGIGGPSLSNCIMSMLDAESVILSQKDHTQLTLSDTRCAPNFIWREKVCQWMYDVADHIRERRNVVYVAMNILDRYCTATSSRGVPASMCEARYEVASLSAVFLAIRIAGTAEITLQDIVRMSRRGLTPQNLIDSGTDMLKELTWEHRIVAPQEYIAAFLVYLPFSERREAIMDAASYLSELAVCEAAFSSYKSSDIALASFLNAVTTNCGQYSGVVAKAIREATSVDPFSDIIGGLRSKLQGLYSLSYDSNRECIPHLISDDEEHNEWHDDVPSFSHAGRINSIEGHIATDSDSDGFTTVKRKFREIDTTAPPSNPANRTRLQVRLPHKHQFSK